jgi:hypothetical protein
VVWALFLLVSVSVLLTSAPVRSAPALLRSAWAGRLFFPLNEGSKQALLYGGVGLSFLSGKYGVKGVSFFFAFMLR